MALQETFDTTTSTITEFGIHRVRIATSFLDIPARVKESLEKKREVLEKKSSICQRALKGLEADSETFRKLSRQRKQFIDSLLQIDLAIQRVSTMQYATQLHIEQYEQTVGLKAITEYENAWATYMVKKARYKNAKKKLDQFADAEE